MVENKIEEQKKLWRKYVAVNILHVKSQEFFSGRPTFGAGKSAALIFVPFPFIARALKVLAALTSVLPVVLNPCYENSNRIRWNSYVKSRNYACVDDMSPVASPKTSEDAMLDLHVYVARWTVEDAIL